MELNVWSPSLQRRYLSFVSFCPPFSFGDMQMLSFHSKEWSWLVTKTPRSSNPSTTLLLGHAPRRRHHHDTAGDRVRVRLDSWSCTWIGILTTRLFRVILCVTPPFLDPWLFFVVPAGTFFFTQQHYLQTFSFLSFFYSVGQFHFERQQIPTLFIFFLGINCSSALEWPPVAHLSAKLLFLTPVIGLAHWKAKHKSQSGLARRLFSFSIFAPVTLFFLSKTWPVADKPRDNSALVHGSHMVKRTPTTRCFLQCADLHLPLALLLLAAETDRTSLSWMWHYKIYKPATENKKNTPPTLRTHMIVTNYKCLWNLESQLANDTNCNLRPSK